jgi:uncharacterized protein YjdB
MGKDMPIREAKAVEPRRSLPHRELSDRGWSAGRIVTICLTLACGAWMVLLSPKAISGLPTANTPNHQEQPKLASPISSTAKTSLVNVSEFAATDVPAVEVPSGLKIAPAQAEMTVGKTLNLRLVDQNGHPVPGATWMVSDFTVAELDSVEPARIAAVAPGQVVVTAMLGDQAVRAAITVIKPPSTIASAARAVSQPLSSR